MPLLDIDRLREDISNLQLTEMSIDYQMLKLNIDTIPSFDGSTEMTNIFIDRCEAVLSEYRAQNNTTINNYLIKAIISKLSGRAIIAIGSRPELKKWPEIRQALYQRFGDTRDIDCLCQELLNMRPRYKESYLDFAERLQLLRSKLAMKINSLPETNMNKDTKIAQLELYDQTALKTFIRGLRGNFQNIIRIKNPSSLESAISLLIEEQNFQYTVRQSNSSHFYTKGDQPNSQFKNSKPNRAIPENFKNNFPQKNNDSRTNVFLPKGYNNNPPPQAMSSRTVYNKNYPKNVFKPKGYNNNPRPEPMSTRTISSRNYPGPSTSTFNTDELFQMSNDSDDSVVEENFPQPAVKDSIT